MSENYIFRRGLVFQCYILYLKLLPSTCTLAPPPPPPLGPLQGTCSFAASRLLVAMAGISSFGAGAAPLSQPMGCRGDRTDNTFSPLRDLLERFPDLFAQKVLLLLDPINRTSLAQAGGPCRAAVAASDLPRAGMRRGS
jgi:hypothetical protein